MRAASASALRKLWAEGGADAVAPYVPEAVFPLYQEAYAAGQYTDFSAAGRCELALLRSACRGKSPFADIRGVSEGLEHRLEAAVRTSTTYDELLDALTTVRYPRARMRRLAILWLEESGAHRGPIRIDAVGLLRRPDGRFEIEHVAGVS